MICLNKTIYSPLKHKKSLKDWILLKLRWVIWSKRLHIGISLWRREMMMLRRRTRWRRIRWIRLRKIKKRRQRRRLKKRRRKRMKLKVKVVWGRSFWLFWSLAFLVLLDTWFTRNTTKVSKLLVGLNIVMMHLRWVGWMLMVSWISQIQKPKIWRIKMKMIKKKHLSP